MNSFFKYLQPSAARVPVPKDRSTRFIGLCAGTQKKESRLFTTHCHQIRRAVRSERLPLTCAAFKDCCSNLGAAAVGAFYFQAMA